MNEDKTILFNLNIYIDYCLKNGFKNKSQKEVDRELIRISSIFIHLKEKDIFEIYYKKLLSRRLIYQLSLSDDLELLMVDQLKKECGIHYTKKIESMLKDFRLSLELNCDFNRQIEAIFHEDLQFQRDYFDMNVHVLTTGFWPFD